MNHFIGIRTIGVPVRDQDRAVAFYAATLGFELVMDAPLPQIGGRWIVVAPPGAATNLALTPASNDGPVDTGVRLVTADSVAAHEHLSKEGVDTDELITWPGVPPMFTFRDQDGNTLYVVQE
ncbi:VOC family protein [Kribbella sp. NPDC023972]|uniref:VOC family protein n=1 Tax=Kribbella sp. NPDC023972 TaxID=3154795 RepID=UPI0033CDDFAB